jgi:hypothetical protein
MLNAGLRVVTASLLTVLLFRLPAAADPDGIAISAEYPRYWQYDGKPVLLLGGWNHGHNPFIDHDTDDDRDKQGVSTPAQIRHAMDELVACGGNYLRCVLDPGMASGVQKMPFCASSGGKFDLNKMVGPFWSRLDTFLAEANRRDIVVQFEVWDRFDLIDGSWGGWPVSPWNPKNNVNYTASSSGLAVSYRTFKPHPFLQGVPGHPVYEKAKQARKEQYDVVRRLQERFMARLLSVALRHDNVLYCMNNETHEDPAWGQYWMTYIRKAARAKGKRVLVTDMFDNAWDPEKSVKLACQFEHRDRYDYVDASQVNSRHAGERHWQKTRWIVQAAKKANPPCLVHMTKIYGNDIALDKKPWSRFRPGDSNNAVEEWWRNLIAGVAGVRFHRPTSGIGLSKTAQSCMQATRKVAEKVRFWDVEPRMDLLSSRSENEAYLAAKPGEAYVLYFTALSKGDGVVRLDLRQYAGTQFSLQWIDVGTGEWGKCSAVAGGKVLPVRKPGRGHEVAAIVAE